MLYVALLTLLLALEINSRFSISAELERAALCIFTHLDPEPEAVALRVRRESRPGGAGESVHVHVCVRACACMRVCVCVRVCRCVRERERA